MRPQAYRHALERGAWAVPTNVEVMELNIPAVHGVGASRIYFVDRHREFSIYDVDFTRIPTVDPNPPALAGLHWFGVVQYIGTDRMEDWTDFYASLFGFRELPDEQRFGILPKGRLLQSPCASFYLQLIEPEPGILDVEGAESLQRIGLGAPDVLAAAAAMRALGMGFVESGGAHTNERGRPDDDATGLGDVRARPRRANLREAPHEPAPGQHRRLRDGHHLAGRHAAGQAGRRSARPASRR